MFIANKTTSTKYLPSVVHVLQFTDKVSCLWKIYVWINQLWTKIELTFWISSKNQAHNSCKTVFCSVWLIGESMFAQACEWWMSKATTLWGVNGTLGLLHSCLQPSCMENTYIVMLIELFIVDTADVRRV